MYAFFYSLKAQWNPPYIKGNMKIEHWLSDGTEDGFA